MALANEKNAIVLNTSNKSELAMGYSTLYGDSVGALSVLGDLTKTQVRSIASSQFADVIPEYILARAPSAELAPDQKDEDHLPPYDQLDPALLSLLSHDMSSKDVSHRVFSQAYKRKQCPPIVRVSECSLDKDWRFPLNSFFSFESIDD